MNDKILMTVLMTVFDENEFLSRAIESVLNQTFTSFEFLIVSEFGADEITLQILYDYAKKDERIRVIQNEKRLGFAASLNKGIALAKGKYIARMDSDDVCYRNRLKLQFDYMEKNPEIMVAGGNVRYIMNDKKTGRVHRYLKSTSQIRLSMLFVCEFAHPTVMFNRHILQNEGLMYNETVKTEDYELWSRIVYRYPVANIGKTLLFYRLHEGNSIKKYKDEVAKSTTEVQQAIFDKFNINLKLKNQLIEGAYDQAQLEMIEDALYQLMKDHSNIFKDRFVFRNRMDVMYRNTEEHLGIYLNKQHRYWGKFGKLYGKSKHIYSSIDYVIFSIKDVLWNVLN